jgi:hypothetical protein
MSNEPWRRVLAEGFWLIVGGLIFFAMIVKW